MNTTLRLAAIAAVPLLSLGLAGCNMGATAAALAGGGSSSGAGLSCEIASHVENGMLVVEPTVTVDAAVTGSYQLQVSGGANGNSANITQGNGFAAGGSGPVTLGRVMLGANGHYTATLTVNAGGETASCTERLGG